MKKIPATTFEEGSIKKLWPFLSNLHKENPSAFEDPDYLRAVVAMKWKALRDPAHCPNCGESMRAYIHKLDFFNALLLKEMGDIVRKRLREGMLLSDANQIHVVSQDFHDCVRHRTTQCRTLGLIAKVEGADGRHDREKGWLITRRGFAALRGARVPAQVEVFRNKITERTDITTTLGEVFEVYDGEYSSLVKEHNENEWVNLGSIYQGIL